MKNLVLSALCLAGLSQAAGCIIVSDDAPPSDGTGDIDVTWALKSSDASGNPIPVGCPAGGDTVTIFAQLGDDTPYSDTFFCADGGGTATRLPPGQYAVWVRITDNTRTQVFAESGAFLANVADGAITPITVDVFTDRAFFQATWFLTRGASGTTCAAEGATHVSILATVSGGSNGFDDDRNTCQAGETEGVPAVTTTPVPFGEYTVVVSALNSAGLSIGDSAPLTRESLDYGNEYESLGDVEIPIR